MHVVPIKFIAGSTAESVHQQIVIKTDLVGGESATCVLTATVRALP
jgi:hypothetical protein